jgi:hypothetical protein
LLVHHELVSVAIPIVTPAVVAEDVQLSHV